MSMGGLERRKFPRIAVSVDVDFTSDANFFTGRLRDISMGGLFIETDVGLRVGAELSIKLTILDEAFDIPSEVTWTLLGATGDVTGVGVRFTKLTDAARASIERFMEKRPPLDFEMLESEQPSPHDSEQKSPDKKPLPR